MGIYTNDNSCMQDFPNKTTVADCGLPASIMDKLFVSVSDHLPRLKTNHKVVTVNEDLSDQYVGSIVTTLKALDNVKVHKATGPDDIPAWVLGHHANVVAPPLTAISIKY